MKCAKCKCEVSISDRTCPKCGNDLLQFRATVFYEPKDKYSQRYGQGIKDMVFGGLHDEMKEHIKTLSTEDRRVLIPIENRLKSLLSKHISDLEIENIFERDILPLIDDLKKDKDAEKIINNVEEAIKNNLGSDIFNHYKYKGSDVLKILRAGEITCLMITAKDVDLSVKMFPYFKASEVACRVHTDMRYEKLVGSTLVKEIDRWIGDNKDIYIRDVSKWFIEEKNNFIKVIDMLLGKKPKHDLSNCRSTGVSIYIFGRESIEIGNKLFTLKNIFNTTGNMEDKEKLAINLCELQDLRNKRVHEDIESDDEIARESRNLSYRCLKTIPEILKI